MTRDKLKEVAERSRDAAERLAFRALALVSPAAFRGANVIRRALRWTISSLMVMASWPIRELCGDYDFHYSMADARIFPKNRVSVAMSYRGDPSRYLSTGGHGTAASIFAVRKRVREAVAAEVARGAMDIAGTFDVALTWKGETERYFGLPGDLLRSIR